MKTAVIAVVLGLATVAATGCDREPTSRTSYNNSGASASGAPAATPTEPAPNIKPPSADLAIPSTVPSEPAAPVAVTTLPTVPDTASPNVPPVTPGAAAASVPAEPAPQAAAPAAPAAGEAGKAPEPAPAR